MGIRNLDKDDLEFAVDLTFKEKWFYTATELRRMLELDPDGSFVYQEEGEKLGFVTTVTYGRTGFLGHLIVSKNARGRSIGDALVQAAVEYMKSRNVDSMVLYASGAIGLYEKYGFKPRAMALAVHSKHRGPAFRTKSARCSPMTKRDLKNAVRLDADLFGDDRGRLMEILFRDHPEMAFKLDRGRGLEGFIFGRPDHVGYDLGPWVSESADPADAEALFRSELSVMAKGMIYTGVFQDNAAARKIINSLDTARLWKVPMMVRGEERYPNAANKVFAVPAMELG